MQELGVDHDEGYLRLGAIRINLPGYRYKHVVRLASDQGEKLNHARGRLKEQRLPYTFHPGTITNCREACPNEETGEVTLDVEVDTLGMPGEDVDFFQILEMFKSILRLKSPEEKDAASSSAASPEALVRAGGSLEFGQAAELVFAANRTGRLGWDWHAWHLAASLVPAGVAYAWAQHILASDPEIKRMVEEGRNPPASVGASAERTKRLVPAGTGPTSTSASV